MKIQKKIVKKFLQNSKKKLEGKFQKRNEKIMTRKFKEKDGAKILKYKKE